MLRLAIPNKGRLNEDTRSLLSDAGLAVRAASDRALVASLGGEFEAIFVRAQDIPEFVADGAADAGITGWDLVRESERPVESRLDLGFGRCRLVVAAKGRQRYPFDRRPRARYASGDGVPACDARILRLGGQSGRTRLGVGAVEIAPHLGIADVILDLTSTGSTLRVNGLREIATVLESTAHLIVAGPTSGRAATGERAQILDELVQALRSVLAARGQRYVMANVPRDQLDAVRRILPGISGPTVIDVMNGGSKVAVHAVCPAEGDLSHAEQPEGDRR